MTQQTTVPLSDLEQDDRINEIQKNFLSAVQAENGYQKLAKEQKKQVDAILETIAGMRFDSVENFITVANALLAPVAKELTPYLEIALNNARATLPDTSGVLVIYTGGTIGSAPKDEADPESPQVVMPWSKLKAAAPRLSSLGYPVDAISFVEPLDSCNVGPTHWRTMTNIIKQHYADYAGFVILHGTDTMAYTASALGFMLQELSKPVVITGSQVAGIVNPRNDAHQNMVTAIELANPQANNLPLIPEVVIAFGNKIIRGTRSKKMDVTSYQGFGSPNLQSLGLCGDHIAIDRHALRAPSELSSPEVYDQLDTHVITIEVFPGMQDSSVLKHILQDDNLKGVVVKAYGAGNIPTQPEFLDLFRDFVAKDGIVVVVTGVPTGQVVMGLYETSQVLLDRGLIGGFDLTAEAALCKLMVLLGAHPDDTATVKRLMQQSLVGEQRLNLLTSNYPGAGKLAASSETHLNAVDLQSASEIERIERVILRFKQAHLNLPEGAKASLRLNLLDGADLGEYQRERVPASALLHDDSEESLAIDLTRHRDLFVSKTLGSKMGARQTLGFKLALQADEGVAFSWQDAELNIYVQD